jgi:ABC-type dipeptide transport system, periplasmic component
LGRCRGLVLWVGMVAVWLLAVSVGYAAQYNEAPSLRARVEAGELPPVEERLPENPLVVGPGVLVSEIDLNYEVGTYGGGIFRSVTADPQLDWNIRDAVMENFLMSPAFYLTPIQGNIAESFEISDDNRVFTLTLRKGLKWSDGVPVTTEDVRFAYEDVLLHEELTPIIPATYRSGGRPDGEPMKLEILDEYTFRITFEEPYGRFVRHLGVGQLWGGYTDLLKPSHYLKRYHIKYTPIEELLPELQANGMGPDEWHRLFHAKDIVWSEVTNANAVGFPTLGPWVRVESPDNLIVMERNPYYYKVDPEGNQLPYVDRYESVVVNDPETIPLTIIGGDVNLNRELIAHDKVSLLLENQDAGGYRVYLDLVYHNAPIALFFNYNNPDETWRQVVLNKDFRRAVNMAINRHEIIDIIFLGLGTTSPWFPGEYNPDEANRILDSIGLDKRDAEGFRLAPDGKPFEIFIEYYEGAAYWQRIVELIADHLEAVGLRTPTRKIAFELWIQRRDANQLYASVDWLDDVNWPYLVYDYMPTERVKWGQQWHLWLQTGGEQGEEPPDWILELYEIDAELRAVRPGTERAAMAEARFAEWMMEYIPMFPVARDVVSPVIIPPNLGNLAHSGQEAASWFAAEQFFFRQE